MSTAPCCETCACTWKRSATAPDPLGVLSHYKAVVWYTANDFVTREPWQVAGTGTSRLALDEQIDVRHFMNEGGKLLFTGRNGWVQQTSTSTGLNTYSPAASSAARSSRGHWPPSPRCS